MFLEAPHQTHNLLLHLRLIGNRFWPSDVGPESEAEFGVSMDAGWSKQSRNGEIINHFQPP